MGVGHRRHAALGLIGIQNERSFDVQAVLARSRHDDHFFKLLEVADDLEVCIGGGLVDGPAQSMVAECPLKVDSKGGSQSLKLERSGSENSQEGENECRVEVLR